MLKLSVLNLSRETGDILGDNYEYLISKFALEAGKKAGEFYTSREVSELMIRIALKDETTKTDTIASERLAVGYRFVCNVLKE